MQTRSKSKSMRPSVKVQSGQVETLAKNEFCKVNKIAFCRWNRSLTSTTTFWSSRSFHNELICHSITSSTCCVCLYEGKKIFIDGTAIVKTRFNARSSHYKNQLQFSSEWRLNQATNLGYRNSWKPIMLVKIYLILFEITWIGRGHCFCK